MGLRITVNADLDAIDAKRWEAAWLASLQLLEQFPASLATSRVDDHVTGKKVLYSTNCRFDVGTPSERWQIDGDLTSRCMAESYELYRHLKQIPNHGARKSSKGKDILWLSPTDAMQMDIAGTPLWGDKTQGYPYHYAMLAIGILLENDFPKQVIVSGDINLTQAEQTRDWAAAVLRRSLAVPVVTDASRLWRRLRVAFVGDEKAAIRRFLALFRNDDQVSWKALLRLTPRPDALALRTVFRDELAQYHSLNQRGALELIKSIYEATEDLELMIDWVCGHIDDESGRAFSPDELLDTLCREMLTIPLEQRGAILEFLRQTFDPLQTIDSVLGRTAAILAGMPVVVEAYLDQERLLLPFSQNWPDRLDEFQSLIHRGTENAKAVVEKYNAQLEPLNESHSRRQETNSSWNLNEVETSLSIPEADFIVRQIAEQRVDVRHREEIARQWGSEFRVAVQLPGWKEFEQKSERDLVWMLTQFAMRNHLILSETAWKAIDRASSSELRLLMFVAARSDQEVTFRTYQVHILESPDLWHYLSDPDA